jgi:hypothetical protein
MIGYPTPIQIANHLYAQGTISKLVARYAKQGMSMDRAIAQTHNEIEGYKRIYGVDGLALSNVGQQALLGPGQKGDFRHEFASDPVDARKHKQGAEAAGARR